MENLFIDGEYVPSGCGRAIEVENSATEEVIADVPDVDRAAAKHVHMDFAQAPSPEWWFPYERPAIEERELAGAKAAPA